ncbi:Arylsulfatase precursor [Stieleria maiorica]|uniref:Arylsulfatase n=1 Tax=Stieleria maiorica TaxID=2795974 RepID=A0A5B9MDR8_9BACT|nr:PVC-type heme-binding CxxCH protein [Stieleria maiorica]QEF98376.1 Arylsulfatase precursor [Stieleria maiorica]
MFFQPRGAVQQLVLCLITLSLCGGFPRAASAGDRPNVVLIMTDNHGAWTLGCYGNRDIRTPHIDRLASEGTLFTRAFASNPVCSPTRATFLTGLIPSQHGVHCFLGGGRLQVGPDARCTLDQLTSLPEVLRDAGYACGLVGKWHLGDNLHPQEGFDDYWITMPHGGTSTFYDAQIIEDGKIRKEPQYLTDFWTRHAVRFIESQSQKDDPFFLFLSYNGPYSLSRLLLREGRNRHAEFYADKELPSFPRDPTHPWQFSNRDYHNNPVSIRRVATEVSGIDDGVGTIMETLKRHGIDRNTVVVFVADQGWVGGHGGFFGMGDHTRPVTARDGMMQIPMIWRHPGGIRSDVRSDRMVTNYDFMPTLLNYLDLADKMPESPPSPGKDFSRELTGDSSASTAETPVFYEFEGLRCIRTERWKYVHRHPNGPHELYDLQSDPDEFNNLVGERAHQSRAVELKERLDAFYGRYAVKQYDMYNGGGSQTRVFVGIDEELAQTDPAPPPPLQSGFQPARFRLPDGFSAELVAGPPLVTHPTLGCLDDRGRLFICNNAGVNLSAAELEEQLPNSIRMLEDTDGDGRFDRSTVFADRMTYPMGGAWHDGALYVASPPNIWRLEDTDDDGVADVRERIVSEFGYTGNAASIHGCFFGPDGRLYWCDGYHGHEFKDEAGNITSKRQGSYLFSCRSDGSDVRIHCGGGMDNPVEVDFTDEGEMIGSVNILYNRPRVDALVHWLYGGAYPHRERVLEELKVTGDLLGPIHRFGHVAVSGITRYRSGVIDHRWRDDFLATFFNSGKVVRVQLERDGSTFNATQQEFLAGISDDFHPTDVIEDADGSLLVVDTGGWFYRGCPTSQMSKPDVLGGIYRIRRDGMTTQVDPWGKRIGWASLSDTELVKHLNDTRHKVRERAIAECARRGDPIIPALSRAMKSDLRVRQNAIWALTRIVGDDGSNAAARAAIRTALSDREPSIRLTACRSIATYADPDAIDQLMEMLREDVAPVRREAAKALGRIGKTDAITALIDSLADGRQIDRSLEHAIAYALIEIDDLDTLEMGLHHPSPRVRRVCMVLFDQSDDVVMTSRFIADMIDSDDIDLQRTATEMLSRRVRSVGIDRTSESGTGPVADLVAKQLRRWIAQPDRLTQRSSMIVQLVSAFAWADPVAAEIGQSLDDASSPQVRDLLLTALSRSDKPSLHPSWQMPLSRLLQSDESEVARLAIAAIDAIATDAFDESLREISRDEAQSGIKRVAALAAMEDSSAPLDADSFSILLDLIDDGAPSEANQAAQMLSTARLSSPQLQTLAPHLTTAGATALRDLIRPYGRTLPDDVAEALLTALESARSIDRLPTTEVSDVIKRFPASLLPRANALLDRLTLLDEQRIQKLDRLIPLVKAADPERGQAVFTSEKAKCATCHRVGDVGGNIGPDLTTIGANRSVHDLMESIVFPSASIVRQYESQTILTERGQVYSGVITRETAESIQLQPQSGDPIDIPRESIEEIAPSTVSIMPQGIETTLSEQELADLVAWLKLLETAGGTR